MFQILDFVARMDILSIKLEVCLPLAYPSTISKNFSSHLSHCNSIFLRNYPSKRLNHDNDIIFVCCKNAKSAWVKNWLVEISPNECTWSSKSSTRSLERTAHCEADLIWSSAGAGGPAVLVTLKVNPSQVANASRKRPKSGSGDELLFTLLFLGSSLKSRFFNIILSM